MLEIWSWTVCNAIEARIISLDRNRYREWSRYWRSQSHRLPPGPGSHIRTVAAQIQLEYLRVLDALELANG